MLRPAARVRASALSTYLAIGIDFDGYRDVLGIWLDTSEGAKFWLKVCNEIKTCGVEDVIFVCCDGLTGLPEVIEAVWPQAIVQTCVVHLICGSMRYVSYQDRKAVSAMLKDIYRAPFDNAALDALERLDATWGTRYPAVTALWRSSWEDHEHDRVWTSLGSPDTARLSRA